MSVVEPCNNPLVTLAVVTYNQVDYIKEAFEGAISQNYPNLEVIISDDYSTDGTFEVIKELVAEYEGPHSIVINQNPENKCTLAHFFKVVDLAKGELLLIAAGDDVSKPERVTETVTVWKEDSSAGIFSNYELINEKGIVLDDDYCPNSRSEIAEDVFLKEGGLDIHGASSAYDMAFVKSLPRPEGRFFFEDAYMSFFIYFFGREISKIDSTLVRYRAHSNSISNNSVASLTSNKIKEKQIKASGYDENKWKLYMSIKSFSVISDRGGSVMDIDAFERYLFRLQVKSSWITMPFKKKLDMLLRSYKDDRPLFYWFLPRVFGLDVFSFLRRFG
ncbi:glycosyltransferase [Oceanisphaera sp. IT1-181]|uniref:glycosyltransferase n=1 Tax=Oceanisphaera sp. IT1-181 TaxID=3081199 RepID=UPI0029C9C632|nr:glycosyltransferase [Oceanisphaera sp. IT1-181]